MKNIRVFFLLFFFFFFFFFSENFQFLEVKLSIYLNSRVFVMRSVSFTSKSNVELLSNARSLFGWLNVMTS